ncbi:hypothetical protein GJ496_005405 [Pomphorhynchus laevis]|nr:hypothetical protein GJ496_005405 [Pomphorhynchus laevis]
MNSIKNSARKNRLFKRNEFAISETSLENSRTIYVGNVAKSTSKKAIKRLFKPFGSIESIRLRGLIANRCNLYKKVALASNRLNEDFRTVIFYVRFENQRSAKEAMQLNSTLFNGRHLRVKLCSADNKQKLSHSVFIGNLPLDVDEENVRSAFNDFGDVSDIRIIRDRYTGMGKGFGYVEFATTAGVDLSLRAHDITVDGRTLRIQPAVKPENVASCNRNTAIASSKCTVTVGSNLKNQFDRQLPTAKRNQYRKHGNSDSLIKRNAKKQKRKAQRKTLLANKQTLKIKRNLFNNQ